MVIRNYGCDQKGRKLSGESGVGVQGFTEGCDRFAISYLVGERIPKSRCIMTEGI